MSAERTYAVGDRIEITVKVKAIEPFDVFEMAIVGGTETFWVSKSELAAGLLLPRPIKVGDWVRHKDGAASTKVEWISEPDDFAVVRYNTTIHTEALSDLVPADPPETE